MLTDVYAAHTPMQCSQIFLTRVILSLEQAKLLRKRHQRPLKEGLNYSQVETYYDIIYAVKN